MANAAAVCEGECWECPVRRHLHTMFELNVAPNGEVYEDKQVHQRRLSKKSKKGSSKGPATMNCIGFGMSLLTFEECCNDRRRNLDETVYVQYETPWALPNESSAELLASNPGIWKMDNFIPDTIVDQMLSVFDADARFDRCNGEAHAHLKCKECFRLSLQNSVNDEERSMLEYLFKKLNNVWPSEQEQRDYLYVQKTHPDCGPTLVHRDVMEHDYARSATATTVFYLTDGAGAGVFFPNVDSIKNETGIAIKPKTGMALTWLNVHPDGTHNVAASHGIQATPASDTIRYAISYRITLSDEELTALKQE